MKAIKRKISGIVQSDRLDFDVVATFCKEVVEPLGLFKAEGWSVLVNSIYGSAVYTVASL